jgi:hypothetical protein
MLLLASFRLSARFRGGQIRKQVDVRQLSPESKELVYIESSSTWLLFKPVQCGQSL